MSEWQTYRHQVAIGGVVSEGISPFAGAVVSATRSDGVVSTTQAVSRSDGSFFFLDLKGVEYTVVARSVGRSATAIAHVQYKPDQSISMSWLHLQLE